MQRRRGLPQTSGTEVKVENPMTENAFEAARKAFFGTANPGSSASPAASKLRNDDSQEREPPATSSMRPLPVNLHSDLDCKQNMKSKGSVAEIVCPRCCSTETYRSRSRGIFFEPFVLRLFTFRPYRCVCCDRRFYSRISSQSRAAAQDQKIRTHAKSR